MMFYPYSVPLLLIFGVGDGCIEATDIRSKLTIRAHVFLSISQITQKLLRCFNHRLQRVMRRCSLFVSWLKSAASASLAARTGWFFANTQFFFVRHGYMILLLKNNQ